MKMHYANGLLTLTLLTHPVAADQPMLGKYKKVVVAFSDVKP